MTHVKAEPSGGARRYNASGRRSRAQQGREAIVEAARQRFLALGYANTTIAEIAGDVDVSVETVYKAFGGKPGIVRAIQVGALAGRGPVHAERRSDALVASEEDPLVIIRGWARLAAEVAPLVAPIHLLVRDAAMSDSSMVALLAEMDDERLDRMTGNARRFATAGHLRRDVSTSEAGQIMWAYSAPELYELLVIRRGWPLPRYTEFIAASLTAALLGSLTS